MKVFIGWSGERSKTLAQAVRDWLPLVLHYVQPWMSEVDIEAGERWAESVAKELESSNFGIICVTRESVNAPWALFEAGALSKSVQRSRVIPLLLDHEFRDITGPLTLFQAKKAERNGIKEMVNSINKIAEQPIVEEQANKLFDLLWPDLEKKLMATPKQSTPPKHPRPQHEVLEELVASVRALDSRKSSEDTTELSRKRRLLPHPFRVKEMVGMISEKKGDPIGLLIISSFFHGEIPWLYELGKEAYLTSKNDTPEEAERAIYQFQRAMKTCVRFFPISEFGTEEFHMIARELDRIVMNISRNRAKKEKEDMPADILNDSDAMDKLLGIEEKDG